MQKKLLEGILIIVALSWAMSAMAQTPHQIIVNGGFETWSAGPGGPPDNWNYGTPHIEATQESGNVHSGIYSSKVRYDSSGTLQFNYLPIPVLPNQTYSCSLWVYDDYSLPGNARMRPWFFFSPTGSSGPSTYSIDTAGWKLYVWSDTSRYNSLSLTLQLRFYGGALGRTDSIYVDDVVLWGPQAEGNAPPAVGPTVRFPSGAVYPTDNVVVRSTMVDSDGYILRDSIYYQLNGGGFSAASHDSVTGNDYWFHLGTHPVGTTVDYYVVAIDDSLARVQSQTFSYTVINEPVAVTPIYYLQYTTNEGELPDCFPSDSMGTAQTITGIVVGRYERSSTYRKRFFVQDAITPWSGLYVYNTPDTVQVGDSVTVSGILTEYYSETEHGTISSITKHASGRPLPAPQILTCAQFNSLDSCSVNFEPYEGMVIEIVSLTLTSDAGFGDFWANDGGPDSVIVMDDLSTGGIDSCIFTIGQTYTHIRGIGRYAFGQYKIAPRFSSDLYIAPTECTGGTIFDVQYNLGNPGSYPDCWPSDRAGDTATVCGIVTAITQGTSPRFYVQDQNNTTWGGIYCYDYTLPNGDPVILAIGDYIQVTAHVHEYYGWTEFDTLLSLSVLGSDQPLPDTTVIQVSYLDAQPSGYCDGSTEPYEDILVRINNVSVTSDNGFGELWIRDASSPDSLRIDSDLWTFGTDQPSPLPAPGSTYDWIVGVVKWQGRDTVGYDLGWIILPRFASDYHQSVFPEPEIVDVWSVNSTTMGVTFDRVMDPVTTQNPGNYSTAHGLAINLAVLDSTGRKVTLTTGVQPNNSMDSLIAVNLCDNLGTCMTVPHYALFHSGLTPISAVQTPAADGDTSQFYEHVVTFKGTIVSDSTMAHPTNLWINDQSGPPYNGVLVYTGGLVGDIPVKGDTVTMTARVEEYFRATEMSSLGDFNNVVIHSSGADPIPYEATAAELLADGEAFEGVLVTLCDSFVVASDSFDQYGFLIENTTTHEQVIVHRQPPQHTRYSYVPVEGTIINGITGVYKFQRDQFRLSPRYDADFNSFDTWCEGGPICCNYIPGDVNGVPPANGIDVTYGVAYFKGGNFPPVDCGTPVGPCPQSSPFYAALDVNGSCTTNGIDITYYVAYLKGGAPLRWCPTCPPCGIFAPSPELPTLMPSLGTKLIPVSGGSE